MLQSKTNLIKNARILKAFILGSALFLGVFSWMMSIQEVKNFKRDFANPIQLNSHGELISSELVQLKDLFSLEAKDHLRLFLDYFFIYDQFNYASKIQKAFSLGDDSLKVAYERIKEKELWYQEVVENSIVQKINLGYTSISIGEKEAKGWPFQVEAPLEISSNKEKQSFALLLRGTLKKTKRISSSNPHGLLISHFSFDKKPIN